MERKVTLKFGYQDKNEKEVVHKEVIFAKRPTGADFIKAADTGDGSDTRYSMSMAVAAITKFGDLMMPVPLSVLLELNEVDRAVIRSEMAKFLADTSVGRESVQLESGKVKLAFGIERDGVKYDVVELGKLLSGFDEIRIEETAENESQQTALKLALKVVKVSDSDSKQEKEGELTLTEVQALDFEDLLALRTAEARWLNSFRT